MQDTVHCINCETLLNGNFCHSCGQRKSVKRITVRTLIEDFSSKWLGWDNKFLRTVKGLTITPGKVIKSYIKGNRVSYVGPLGYTFLTTAIMILLYSWFNVDVKELLRSSQEAFGNTSSEGTEKMKDFIDNINNVMTENFRYMVMTMIPFLALSGIMFYSGSDKKRTNYLEQCVLFFYLAGHSIWINIMYIPVIKLVGFQYFWTLSLISYGFTLFGIYNFHDKKGFKGIMKAFFSYVVGFSFFMIFVMIVTIIYLVFFTDFIQSVIDSVPKN